MHPTTGTRQNRPMSTPTRRFGHVAGTGYVAIGLLGFAVTGLSGFAATRGSLLVGLEVNPVHNLLHVGVGSALVVAAARGEPAAHTLALLVSAVYGVLGLLGLGLVGTTGNVLALNTADNVLHLATAATAAAAAHLDPRHDRARRFHGQERA